jgi:protein N-terminal methyltransferase
MRAKSNLKEGGVIVVKENASDRGFFVDKEDCSVIRSNALWKKLFEEAGLKIIKEDIQRDWPKDMFDLRMYALV